MTALRCLPLPLRASAAAAALALALLPARPARALSLGEERERLLAADRQRALAEAQACAGAVERTKPEARDRLAALDAEAAAAQADLASLQKDLMAVLAADDPSAMKVVRARVAARQAAAEAAEGEKALIVKQGEEAERERDAWKKHAATHELALRMDMKVMLAGAADIEDREKRVEAAIKEIDYQAGQIRKYATRQANAALALDELRSRLAALARDLSPSTPADLRQAREEEAVEVRRLAAQQKAWFLFNHRLERSARRSLAFARAEHRVSRSYADALAHKAGRQRADDALAAAQGADARLAELRAATAPLQKAAADELAAAAAESDEALRRLSEARTSQDQERARSAYAAAQARRNRCEAESDCWKEFIALQKAGAAFTRELADRARGTVEDRNVAEITQEEGMLREGLGTSEQYVRSLQQMVEKTDGLIESARRELGVQPEAASAGAAPLAELFGAFDTARPPAPELVADQLRVLVETLAPTNAAAGGAAAAGPRRDAARTLTLRLAQREMLRVRKGISERWLENSREAIRTLERLAGARLWHQSDPRLNASTCQELGTLLAATASDAAFAWTGLWLRLGEAPGLVGWARLLRALGVVAALGVSGWFAASRLPADRRLGWLAGRLLRVTLPVAAAGAVAIRLGQGNLAIGGLGWLLVAAAAWMAIRHAVLSVTADHRPPAGSSLAGGLFAALQAAAVWAVVLLPVWRLAGQGENAWDVRAVVSRLWLFGLCLAGFRLALHPTLMGRLLSRRSEHRGLRWLGTAVGAACIAAAALAALPYLAGLNSLGRTVLSTVEASFALLAAALAGVAAARWLARRRALQTRLGAPWTRVLQTLIMLAAGAAVVAIWGWLLNRVVLAPNAPQAIQDLVRAAAQAAATAGRIWRRELTPGMTVSSLARGILVFVLSFWVSRAARRVFQERVLSRTPMDEATRQTFATILGYAIILLGFLVGLNVAGSSLQNLALLAGAITVGLGFGLQNVINNFVSSLLIHFGRTIRVGDYIDVGGTRGTVREIGLRSTTVGTDDGITVLIPNGAFISGNIINWTNPSRRTRLHVPMTLTRQADLTAATELATAVARNHSLILKEPGPVVEVRTVTAAQVNLELLAWTEKPEKLVTIVGELGLALDRALREKGFMA